MRITDFSRCGVAQRSAAVGLLGPESPAALSVTGCRMGNLARPNSLHEQEWQDCPSYVHIQPNVVPIPSSRNKSDDLFSLLFASLLRIALRSERGAILAVPALFLAPCTRDDRRRSSNERR